MNATVKAILSERRKNALSIAAADNERAMEITEFRDVELEIRRLRYEIAIGGQDLGDKLTEFEQERARLVEKYKLTLEPPYRCTVCNDTGYLPDGRLCACAKRLATEEFKRKLNLDNVPGLCFEEVDFSVFGESEDQYRKTYGKMQAFCEKFDTTKIRNIVLLGEVGTGKTYLTACILDRMVKDGRAALFLTAFEFGRACLAHHTAQQGEDILEALLESDLLILDDLGTEPIYRNVTLEYLYSVLNERLRREKKTIVTSNLSPRALMERYGERIFSRLNNKATCVTLELRGKDLRRGGR